MSPITVTLVRYQPGETNAIIQIIASRETLAVQVPIVKEAGWPLLIRVSCSPKRSGIGRFAADTLSFFGIGVESGFATNFTLPFPPITPLP